jgi:hypothetical protein
VGRSILSRNYPGEIAHETMNMQVSHSDELYPLLFLSRLPTVLANRGCHSRRRWRAHPNTQTRRQVRNSACLI